MKSKKPDDITDSIRESEYFKRYRKIYKRLHENVDLEKIEREISTLHSGRISRSLVGTSPGPDKIIEANLQDSSYRSRLVELRVEISRSIVLMETTIDSLKLKLSSEHSESLRHLRTKGERLSFIDSFLVSGLMFIQKMESLQDNLDVVIKDIDQTAYTYKNAIQVLELVYSRNNDRKL